MLSIVAVLLAVSALLWVLLRIRTLVFMLFVSLFVAVALEPAVQQLARRGWRRGVATGVVFAVAFLLGVGFVAALVPLFVSQASQLVANIPSYLENLQELVDRFGDIQLVNPEAASEFQDLGSLVGRFGGDVAGGVFAVGNTILGLVFRFVTIGLFSFYMVAEGPKMRRILLAFLPPGRQRIALRIWEISVDKTGGYIYSRAVLAAVAAVFTTGVLTLLDVPFAIALGMWVGVLSQFVPVIGTYIALVLPALVALVQSPGTALWVVGALVAYQQVENYLIAPRVTERTMSLHPAVSVGAVIAGASILGGIGAVLALPVAAILQALASTTLHRHELVEELRKGPSGEARADEGVHAQQGGPSEVRGEGIEGVGTARVDG